MGLIKHFVRVGGIAQMCLWEVGVGLSKIPFVSEWVWKMMSLPETSVHQVAVTCIHVTLEFQK